MSDETICGNECDGYTCRLAPGRHDDGRHHDYIGMASWDQPWWTVPAAQPRADFTALIAEARAFCASVVVFGPDQTEPAIPALVRKLADALEATERRGSR